MKETLLKLFPVEAIVMFLLRWFHGITDEQFKAAKLYVANAEEVVTGKGKGAEKKQLVFGLLKDTWPQLANFAVDLLIQLTLSYLVRKGVIK